MRQTFRQPLVGERLQALRLRAGLSRAELSAASGIDASTLARLEGGNDVRLSSYLGVIDYFLRSDPQAWMLADRVAALDPHDRLALSITLLAADGGQDG